MALLQCGFRSEVLEMEQPLHVILPQISMLDKERQKEVRERGFPVLYLLHGLSDDNTCLLYTS
ncbi:MAG: esterase family protein, partial [Clostridia bacterium]|nr:esterase family protein [Clostridia bacterium]